MLLVLGVVYLIVVFFVDVVGFNVFVVVFVFVVVIEIIFVVVVGDVSIW